eukprot:s1278_g5.t1
MPPLYDITVKHTFLNFQPVDLSDESEQCFRQTLSCPCLSFLATSGEAGVKTDSSSGSQLPDVASSVSTDNDIPPNKGVNRKAVEKLQAQDVSMGNRKLRKALATQMRLNKQLMQASRSSWGKKAGGKPDIFTLVRTQIHQMNAVNLSTAIHRIARLGGPADQNEMVVLEALLNVIQEKTWRQLQNHDESMPAGCATIVAWSCASLQVFRHDLFAALIQVVEAGLGTCKDFEVTNLLWACTQLVKHLLKDGPEDGLCSAQGLGRPLCALMDAVEVYFQGRLQDMTSQTLVSALVSVAMLSAVGNTSVAALFSSICDALALKHSELSLNNKTQVGIAGRIMRKNHEQVVQAVRKSFSEKCPELATYFRV